MKRDRPQVTDDRRRETSESAGPSSVPGPQSPPPRPRSSVSGLSDTEVTYTLAHKGNFYVIEHVPARVCQETGEEFFAPETVEHIHALIEGKRKPDRTVRTPVYEYS
jgi:YgiT-type zinc finger domain-containing protein